MNGQSIDEAHPNWDMTQTRELVGQKYDADQLAKLRPVMRAVSIRLMHARIHFADYQRLVETCLAKPLQDGVPVWDLMFVSDEESVGANNGFFVTCEAHVYACVQAMHAIADNLAHVAYYVLGWNVVNKPPLHKVAMATVLERLRQLAAKSTDLLPIRQAFEDLNAKTQYQVLADIVNHLKHHGGVHVTVSWGASEEEPFRVLLSAFSRNATSHPQREISSYLEDTFDIVSRSVVQIGCALTDWLRDHPRLESAQLRLPEVQARNEEAEA